MLERPGLLLNPWAIRSTDVQQEMLENLTEYGGASGKGESAGRRSGSRRWYGGKASPTAGNSLDFLAEAAVVLSNLVPDEKGVIQVPRAALGDKHRLQIIVVDPRATLHRTLALKAPALKARDLRLVRALPPRKAYTEQRVISAVEPGKPVELRSAGAARFEALDSLGKVYRLFGALTGNAQLVEFNFVLRWPDLPPEEKMDKYAKYASHELNFFLHRKDPVFFKAVIAPYLKNKKNPTFMDHWLLEADLTPYLEPWKLQRLNSMERVLLGQRTGRGDAVSRHVNEFVELLPPNPDGDRMLFDTAVQGGALEGGGGGGGAGLGGGGFFGRAVFGVDAERQNDANFALGALEALDAGMVATGGSLGTLQARGMAGKKSNKRVDRLASLAPAAPPPPGKPTSEAMKRPTRAKKALVSKFAEKAKVMDRLSRKGDDDEFYDDFAVDRKKQRQLFRKLDQTKEWAENNYYKRPIAQQLAALVGPNGFWRDYAAHKPGTPFLSSEVVKAANSFTEMMCALAVLDLPFVSEEHKSEAGPGRLMFTAGNRLLLFRREIRETEKIDDPNPVLVTQHFFRADDRYRHENNQQYDKYVQDEFLPGVVYGGKVILTNPHSHPQDLNLLLQIPAGAIPVQDGFYTRGHNVHLEAYATQAQEFLFYFPTTGKFAHHPVNVSREGGLVATVAPITFNVVEKLTKIDEGSWAWISQHGTDGQVLAYLRDHNLHRIQLGDIAFRLKNKAFFTKLVGLLESRHHYHNLVWSYGLHHQDLAASRSFLQHSEYANRCGAWIDTPLLTIDPVARYRYQHLEYAPLVNPRVHPVGRDRKILNDYFLSQYQQFMHVLTYRPKLDDADRLGTTYYLFLQDRVDEALAMLGEVDENKVPSRLQLDYLRTYAAFYEERYDEARALATPYKKHPVDKWRERFVQALNQLEGVTKPLDTDDREQSQTELAVTEPTVDMRVEDHKIVLDYANLKGCTLHFYPMDVELLFSRNPFIGRQSAQFSVIRPDLSRSVELPGDQQRFSYELPARYQNQNVMVEVVAGGIRKSVAYYANAMAVQVMPQYGHLRVAQHETRKPLSKVYVKTYARMRDGKVKFFKDGYTDFRGRFDYVSLNTNELDHVDRFSILMLHPEHGAVIQEAFPPKR